MKSILISIRPKWVAKILKGEKTIEIRKTAPKCDLPIDVYIYCTKGDYIGHISNKYVGKVVAKFTLRKVEEIDGLFDELNYEFDIPNRKRLSSEACIDIDDLTDYLTKGKYNNNDYDTYGYAWHISDLVMFNKPKELDEFDYPNPSGIRYVSKRSINGLPSKKHPPQSWLYVEEKE